MTNKKENNSPQGIWALLGLLAGIFLFLRGGKKISNSTLEQSEEIADQNLRLNAARIFARRFNVPLVQIIRVLDNPKKNPQLWSRMNSELNKSEVMFSIKNRDEITVSLEMQWNDGTKTTGRQTWKNNEVPKNVLKELQDTQEPILIDWILED